MPHPAQLRSLLLPRGWPRRVRSAVVQVISLTRTSLALTQSWASESLNRELQRGAEGDRLQQEVHPIKSECTRRLSVVPFRLAAFEHEVTLYFYWYNGNRPHIWLRGATPDEMYHRRRPAIRAPRFLPRACSVGSTTAASFGF